ncbi:MAG: PorT family protein [Bacteroidaceae bacterium]|nr:PorT family protein [Bacteroidaceae bacterium]
MRNLRLFILLSCALLCRSFATAQVGDPRNDWTFGVNGGAALDKISFHPWVNQKWHTGPTYGLTARYTCEKYYKMVCAIQLEVNYASLGWKEDIVLANGTQSSLTSTPETYQRDIHYLQVPLLARLGMGREYRGVMGYLVAGPQLAYMLRESTKHSDYWHPDDRINGRNEQYGLSVKNRFDYGITAGLGMEVSTAAGHFLLEGRYYFGLSNLFGASKKDPFGRSANGAIVGKVTYLLPNGGRNKK